MNNNCTSNTIYDDSSNNDNQDVGRPGSPGGQRQVAGRGEAVYYYY